MSNDKYTTSQFKVLIERLLQNRQGDEFKTADFQPLFNGLADKHRTYIEEKAVALNAIDYELEKSLAGKDMLTSLFVFQLHVLRDYLRNIMIEDSNINTTLMQMNQKFSNLVDISTKGLLPSGFNSDARNNLTKVQEKLQSHIPLIDQYLSEMWKANNAQRQGLEQVIEQVIDQGGGANVDEYMKIMKKLTDVYSIFNSDLLLKAMSLLSASNLSEVNFGKDIFNKLKELFQLLFINMNDYKSLSLELFKTNKTLETNVARDNMIYNNISSKLIINYSGNMILIKTLFDSLKLENQDLLTQYLRNPELSEDFLKLLTQFITQIEPISAIYIFLHSQYPTINNLYEAHVEEKKKVFAYVKKRTDDGIENKRFTFKETNKFLSLKYSADDNFDETNSGATKPPEYYYFGPYTNTFLKNESNEEIADSTSKLILERLITKREHVFVLGYGQSGAGKTSTLINSDYTDKNGTNIKELGIIPFILKNPKFVSGTTTIQMEVVELTANNKHDYIDIKYIDNPVIDANGNPVNIKYLDPSSKQPYNFSHSSGSWVSADQNKLNNPIEHYMLYCVDKRRTYPTSNNPDSSRSHILIILKCIKDSNSSFLICGDLAGVENAFNCNDYTIIKKMVNSFGASKQSWSCSGRTQSCPRINFKEYPEWDSMYDIAYQTIDNPNNNDIKEPPEHVALRKLKTMYTQMMTEVNKTGTPFNSTNFMEGYNFVAKFDYATIFPAGTNLGTSIKHNLKKKDGEGKKDGILVQMDNDYSKNIHKTSILALDNLIRKNTTEFTESMTNLSQNKKQIESRQLILRTIKGECGWRTTEGQFINKSLKDMREDIKSILLSNFNNDTLYFDKTIFPYCINTTIKQSKLEKFYTGSSNAEIKGDVMKIVQSIIGLPDLKKLNFVIFTIIKTDTKNQYNNPPNAPYINTNDLYYHTYINSNPNALATAIINIRDKAMDTRFYKKDENKLYDVEATHQIMEKLQPIAIELLKQIDTNNDATLIGSLISTEKLNNLIFDKMICSYNKDFNKILTQFNPQYFPVTATPNFNPLNEKTNLQELEEYNQSITRKYMKYKSKYMMKLKSRALKK
jgi:hypothetical protein